MKYPMSKLEKIEESVATLSDAELKRFAAWFADYQWERWDRQLEQDAEAGKLDKLADQALADFDAGRAPGLFGPPYQPCLLVLLRPGEAGNPAAGRQEFRVPEVRSAPPLTSL